MKSGARFGIRLSVKREATQGEEPADGYIPTDSESPRERKAAEERDNWAREEKKLSHLAYSKLI